MSVTSQAALNPIESSSFFCSLRCCSKPKSLPPTMIAQVIPASPPPRSVSKVEVGEAVIALQPDGLLAAILCDLVAGEGVVERQGQRVGRRELHHALSVDTFALEVREGVAHVVGHAVELADGRRVGHRGIRPQRRRRAGPRLDVPGVFGGLHRAAVALLIAGAQPDAPGLVVIGRS